MGNRQRVWKGFWQLADPKIWLASLVPFLLGISIASSDGFSIPWPVVACALLVLILIEIGKNGVNEFFDYRSGADLNVQPEDRTDFSGGKKVIVDGILNLKEVAIISVATLTGAIVASIPVLWSNPGILPFGIIGFVLAMIYSIPPISLSYRGLGEVTVGFTFGPLIVNGAYFLVTGRISDSSVLLSLPLGFLIANVLWVNEIPDVEADQKAGKWNLVARLGRKNAVWGYVCLFLLAYLAVALAAIILHRPLYFLGLGSSLLVPSAVSCARKYHSQTKFLIKANGTTILIYVLTGVLLACAALLYKL